MQQWSYFVVKVAHDGGAGSPAAEQVVEPVESMCDFVDCIDIGPSNLP
jgi:hypothetical protein